MTLLPLTTCAQMLGVHPKTLHHWLQEAQVPVETHPTDARIKCLAPHRLSLLARLHARSLPEQPGAPVLPEELPPSLPPPGAAEPDLMQRLSSLEARVASAQEQLAGLALALLAERERTFECRIAALETRTAELLARSVAAPTFPEGQMTIPMLAPALALCGPGTLNSAELRARSRLLALIEYGADGGYVMVSPTEGELSLIPDSPEWFEWLARLSSFRFVGKQGAFTAYRKGTRKKPSRTWSAQRYFHQHNYRSYLGVTDHLTIAVLEHAAVELQSSLQ